MTRQLLTPIWFCAVLGVFFLTQPARRAPAAPTPDGGFGERGEIGPDVIVGDLPAMAKWGTVNGITGYSTSTTSCNIGDEPLPWFEVGQQHPVIAQNLYRLKDGRFEQLGMSWVKHGYCAQQRTVCGSCQRYCDGGCCNHLGVNCSDPYTATENGTQSGMGPRSEINAFTGEFPWPFGTRGESGNAIYKRLQVTNDDLNPSKNKNALYFVEGVYATPDDAAAGNGLNNASYREVRVGSFQGGGYNLNVAAQTQRTDAAVYAWQAVDPEVQIANVVVPDEGHFLLASRVTQIAERRWHYEYALLNMNSDRSGRGFSVPILPVVAVEEIGFRDINYHSGEPYDSTDWSVTYDQLELSWAGASYEENPDANALRWGTLYNFRFDADVPPAEQSLRLTLFKPGEPDQVEVRGPAPRPVGDLNCDGAVDLADIDGFVLGLSNGEAYREQYPDCDLLNGDLSFDRLVDFADIDGFVELLSR